MGAKLYSIIAAFIMFASFNTAFATSSASLPKVDAFLSGFNVSGATENALTYANISYDGGSYLLAYYGGSPYLLINSTSGYSFVLNPSAISAVITPAILQSSISQLNDTYLSNALIAYNASSASTINDCLVETGLNQPNASCTAANLCESCRTVPICGGVQSKPESQLSASGGYGSPFQIGIENFESNYTRLVSNISIYMSAVSSLKSASSAQLGITDLNKAFDNITTITELIYQNPIFTPTTSQGGCNPALAYSQQPWYCVAYGFCGTVTYNYTLLSNIQNYISRINALPISSAQISSIAQGISSNENKYASVIIASDELKQRNNILATTMSGYNGISAGAAYLLANVSNATLSSRLAALNANYSLLLNSYASVNLTKLNYTLDRQYSSLKSLYLSVNASYRSALGLSYNNTALLLGLESESSSPSQQVVSLSFREATLENQLTSKPSNINAVERNLSSLNTEIKAVPPTIDVAGEVSRSFGGPLAALLLGSSSFSNGVANAPLAATVPSIIISIVILAVLFLVYKRLHRHGRIRHSRKTSKNWKILFAISAILLLLYIFWSYSTAVAANSSASLPEAAAAIGASKSVAIAINGTSTPSLVACESRISAILVNQSKTVHKITINGEACNTGTGIQTTDSCLGQYAASGVPVIILTNSTRNTLTAYSFYGTILSQSGNQQFTDSCLASLFLG